MVGAQLARDKAHCLCGFALAGVAEFQGADGEVAACVEFAARWWWRGWCDAFFDGLGRDGGCDQDGDGEACEAHREFVFGISTSQTKVYARVIIATRCE